MDEITKEELKKIVSIIGINQLEIISYIALKNENQKVYQAIVFVCNDKISKIDKPQQK